MKKHQQKTRIVPITKKALDSLKNKEEAFHAGVNAGIEHRINYEFGRRFNEPFTPPEPKWKDVGPRFQLAGVSYGDAGLIAGGLKPGTVVQLVGEPSNIYDSNAVKIYWSGMKLGYIPVSVWVLPESSPTIVLKQYCWTLHKSGYKLIGVITDWQKFRSVHISIQVQIKQTITCPRKEERPQDVRF